MKRNIFVLSGEKSYTMVSWGVGVDIWSVPGGPQWPIRDTTNIDPYTPTRDPFVDI